MRPECQVLSTPHNLVLKMTKNTSLRGTLNSTHNVIANVGIAICHLRESVVTGFLRDSDVNQTVIFFAHRLETVMHRVLSKKLSSEGSFSSYK